MRIDAGPGGNQHFTHGNFNRQLQAGKKTAGTEAVAPQIGSDTKADLISATSERGVIRNLQDGHFKGVADVRLRTIFHAELRAAEDKIGLTTVRETASQITEAVSSQFESLVDLAKLDGEKLATAKQLYGDFQNSLAKIVSNASDPRAAIADLRSTVDTFLSSFKGLLSAEPGSKENAPDLDPAAAIPETREGEIGVNKQAIVVCNGVDVGTEVTDDQSQIVAPGEATGWQSPGKLDWFIQAFNDLATKIDGMFTKLNSSLLESSGYEPVPPKSNGVAFEKFLAIYREMNSSAVVESSEPVITPTVPEVEQRT